MSAIVMTGGSSGLGEVAARRLLREPNIRLLMGARGDSPPESEIIPLNLSDLESTRSFAEAVIRRLGEAPIDALVLNAGTNAGTGDSRTSQGFETTFVVNYLAHYLLVRLLLPKLAKGARIVLTTSGTHDAAENTIIPPPRHANARLPANPELDPDQDQKPQQAAGRAYSSSKLCVILLARSLALRNELRELGVAVVAYDPGLTPGTGLIRNSGLALNIAWWLLGTPLGLLAPGLSSRKGAGDALADLALGALSPDPGQVYAALRHRRVVWIDPSVLARRDDLRDALWRDSAVLLRLRPEHP